MPATNGVILGLPKGLLPPRPWGAIPGSPILYTRPRTRARSPLPEPDSCCCHWLPKRRPFQGRVASWLFLQCRDRRRRGKAWSVSLYAFDPDIGGTTMKQLFLGTAGAWV